MVFPVVMYGCESWTAKKAECRRADAFELRCWRRLLQVPWTVRRSNQSILKEISPEYSLEGLMLNILQSHNTCIKWLKRGYFCYYKQPPTATPMQYLLVAWNLFEGWVRASETFGIGANSMPSIPFTILEFLLLVGPTPLWFLRPELISYNISNQSEFAEFVSLVVLTVKLSNSYNWSQIHVNGLVP